MDVEVAIRARLLTDPEIMHLVADRVTWVERPQAQRGDAITLQVINEPFEQHLKGFHSLQPITIQLDGWATTHAAGRAIKDAAVACLVPAVTLHPFKFGRGIVSGPARDLSGRTQDGRLYFRPSLDFTLHYSVIS